MMNHVSQGGVKQADDAALILTLNKGPHIELKRACIFICIIFINIGIIRTLTKENNKTGANDKKLSRLAKQTGIIASAVVALVTYCMMMNIKVGSAIAGATVFIGLFSFAIKDNLSDLVSGIIFLTSKHISIGDRVRVMTSTYAKMDDQNKMLETSSDIIVTELNLFMMEGYYTKRPDIRVSIRYSTMKAVEHV